MTTLLGLGWKPDPDLARGLRGPMTTAKVGATGPLPRRHLRLADFVGVAGAEAVPRADAPSWELPVLGQGATQRCVAFTGSEVTFARQRAQGIARPVLVDYRTTYLLAQAKEQRRFRRRVPYVDAGLHPFDWIAAVSHWGATHARGERDGRGLDDPSLAEEHVLDPLPEAEVRAAATLKISGWRRTPDSSAAEDDPATHPSVLEAKRFLSRDVAGWAGFDLDAPFGDYAHGVWERDPLAPSIGRHAMGLFGFDDDVGPSGAFLVLNHWTRTWGLSGWVWISYQTYASSSCSDRYWLDVAPAE